VEKGTPKKSSKYWASITIQESFVLFPPSHICWHFLSSSWRLNQWRQSLTLLSAPTSTSFACKLYGLHVISQYSRWSLFPWRSYCNL